LKVLLHCYVWQSCRAQKVSELLTTVRDLCNVLGMDFCSIAAEVHQSLIGSTSVHSISTSTLNKLANKVLILKEEKKRRLRMVVTNNIHAFSYL
jgi:protein regulator of cytokinesis 1